MKVVEVSGESFPLGEILTPLLSGEHTEVILRRDGHALARVSAFNDEDYEEWLFEHDPANIADADAAREEVRAGQGLLLDEVRRLFHESEA